MDTPTTATHSPIQSDQELHHAHVAPSRSSVVYRLQDPRYYQIAVLSALLVYGITHLDFRVGLAEISVLITAALVTQGICGRIFSVPFDPKSPLISALSLSLLARAGGFGPLAFTAVAAIASKFLIRRRGKHVFNPTNFGLVSASLLSGQVWVSPGQWGSGTILAFMVACFGMVVVHRSARSDVTWAFLLAYAAILFGRATWLGDPWGIPLHNLNSGAFLLFSFFMISDPKTTPDTRAGRLLYAVFVAIGSGLVHFVFYQPNGFIWSLVCCAPFVPILDRLFPGERYRWSKAPATSSPLKTLFQPSPQLPSSGGTQDVLSNVGSLSNIHS
jgi:Na+-transporting NADH:ubiquinone oxidoreductase subunit NqrB